MKVDVRKPNFRSVQYVISRMRAADKSEIYATRWLGWSNENFSLRDDVLSTQPYVWVICRDHPVAVIGASELHPGIWSVYMFATDEFPKIAICMTRLVKKTIIPLLLENGAHRAQCQSSADHHTAHKWLEILGARKESVLEKYGKNQEDFFQFVWNIEDVRTPKRQFSPDRPSSRDSSPRAHY